MSVPAPGRHPLPATHRRRPSSTGPRRPRPATSPPTCTAASPWPSYDDRQRKTQEIQALERDIAGRLVQTPYVLLLSFPGINVVSAADFAGEMGPIEHYANAKAITGRAGLCPSRYQSDRVDQSQRPAGPPLQPLAARRHPRHRRQPDPAATTTSARWPRSGPAGKDPRHTHVKVGLRFCRIAFQMVAGRQVFRHPGIQGRHYILDKLIAFHRDHDTGMAEVLRDLQAAIGQLPPREHAAEAKPLAGGTAEDPGRPAARTPTAGGHPADRAGTPGGRRGTIDRVRGVDLRRTRFASRERLIVPKGQTLRKAWRSLGSPTPDTAPWGHSPDVPVWRDGDRTNERGRLVKPSTVLPDSLMKPLPDGGVHRP